MMARQPERLVVATPSLCAAAYCTCLLATVIAVFLFWATGTSVAVVPLAPFAGAVLILAGLNVIYTRWRPDPIIGPVAGGLAVVTWAGLVAGMAALAALRTGAPLIDVSLARADAILGLYTPTLVAWMAPYSIITSVLEVAYVSTVPMVFATVILLGLRRRETRMWELCFVFAATAPVCAFLAAGAPAIGAFTYYGVSPDILTMLPTGAGRFFLPVFQAYHSRTVNVIDVRHLEGVVEFPSFHAIMALMTAHALRDLRALSGLAWTWSSIILISTIPIGGHYVIDIIGGALIWAVITLSIHIRAIWHPDQKGLVAADR
ncbi:MAG: phosphatase PAP2 family protein [Janthinobacterium lividum]